MAPEAPNHNHPIIGMWVKHRPVPGPSKLAFLIAAYSTLGLVTYWVRGSLVGVSAALVVLAASVGALGNEWVRGLRRS